MLLPGDFPSLGSPKDPTASSTLLHFHTSVHGPGITSFTITLGNEGNEREGLKVLATVGSPAGDAVKVIYSTPSTSGARGTIPAGFIMTQAQQFCIKSCAAKHPNYDKCAINGHLKKKVVSD